MRPLTFGLLLLLTMLLCSCVSDQQRQDIHDNAQASYNAAASLPGNPPQAQGIEASQVAIGVAVGLPITVPPAPSAPPMAPAPATPAAAGIGK